MCVCVWCRGRVRVMLLIPEQALACSPLARSASRPTTPTYLRVHLLSCSHVFTHNRMRAYTDAYIKSTLLHTTSARHSTSPHPLPHATNTREARQHSRLLHQQRLHPVGGAPTWYVHQLSPFQTRPCARIVCPPRALLLFELGHGT